MQRRSQPHSLGGVSARPHKLEPQVIRGRIIHDSHPVMWYDNVRIWACSACGGMAEDHLRLLASACRGWPSREGQYVLRCLAAGLRPYVTGLSGSARARPVGSSERTSSAASRTREGWMSAASAPAASAPSLDGSGGASHGGGGCAPLLLLGALSGDAPVLSSLGGGGASQSGVGGSSLLLRSGSAPSLLGSASSSCVGVAGRTPDALERVMARILGRIRGSP